MWCPTPCRPNVLFTAADPPTLSHQEAPRPRGGGLPLDASLIQNLEAHVIEPLDLQLRGPHDKLEGHSLDALPAQMTTMGGCGMGGVVPQRVRIPNPFCPRRFVFQTVSAEKAQNPAIE